MKELSLYALGLILIVGFLYWNATMDGPRAQAAQDYEKCVQEQYSKHPSWFTANGQELPECKQ